MSFSSPNSLIKFRGLFQKKGSHPWEGIFLSTPPPMEFNFRFIPPPTIFNFIVLWQPMFFFLSFFLINYPHASIYVPTYYIFHRDKIWLPIIFYFPKRGQPLFFNFHNMGPPIIKKKGCCHPRGGYEHFWNSPEMQDEYM